MRKIISGILAAIMCVGMSVGGYAAPVEYGKEYENQPSLSYEQTFEDVSKSHWAFEYIAEMANRDVISGYPNGYFYPENNVSRAEFAKIMSVAAGLVITQNVSAATYTDVTSKDWFAPYVEAARYYLSGYKSNGELYYLPNEMALREDIAVALVKLKGYDTSLFDESILKAMFTDWQSISEGARKYVAIAVEQGLISGYEDNTFRGQSSITRAEAATLLWRAYQYGSDNKVFEPEDVELPTETEKPIEQETIEKEPNKDKDIVEETQTEPEYLYELKTIADGVSNIDLICNDDKGNLYYIDGLKSHDTGIDIYFTNDNPIMKVTKNGNSATAIFDKYDIGNLSDRDDLTKKQIADRLEETSILTIGYNKNDDCLYALVSQYDYYVYNITEKSFVKLEEKPTGEEQALMRFDSTNSMYLGWLKYINYNVDEAHREMFGYGGTGDKTYANMDIIDGKNVVYTKQGKIYVINSRTGEYDEVDYYIPDSTIVKLIGADEDYIYAVGKNTIYGIDLNGDYEVLFTTDDVDNVDGKTINFDEIQYKTACVDNDGTIYYWDKNYQAIRQISKK